MYKVIGADQTVYGPAHPELIRQWIREHRLHAQSLAQAEEGEEWRPLSQWPEFQAEFVSLQISPDQVPVEPAASYPETFPTGGAPSNSMAVAGFVFGILSIFPGLCCCSGFPFNLLGLIFSSLGLSQAKRDPDQARGKNMALAGLVLSLISLGLALFTTLLGYILNLEEWVRPFRP